MRALVTGASGFVGRHLIRHLSECDDIVLGTYASHRPEKGYFEQLGVELSHLDITSYEKVLDLVSSFKPDIIYHLAAIAFVPKAEADFGSMLSVNVGGAHNLFRAAHIADIGAKIVFASSGEVYGRVLPSELPITEDTPLRPANNYSLGKRMAELVAERYNRDGNVKIVIMRSFNHVGAGQNEQFVVSSFARQLAQIKLSKREPVISVGNLKSVRDFSDVRDVCAAYRLAAERGTGVYNIASGRSVAIEEVLKSLIDISGIKVEVRKDPARMRPSEVPEVRVDISRATNELGWRPKYLLRDSLEEAYKYWLEVEKGKGIWCQAP
ncbi:MAG: NAD-dependent epimerase/dehydratase family protein [Candidatus Dadabacteria bacterium]|nr:MAG: NAD-dependent epimerase/dehydratase family protein [Candidatus Dadabacteria bacterium]